MALKNSKNPKASRDKDAEKGPDKAADASPDHERTSAKEAPTSSDVAHAMPQPAGEALPSTFRQDTPPPEPPTPARKSSKTAAYWIAGGFTILLAWWIIGGNFVFQEPSVAQTDLGELQSQASQLPSVRVLERQAVEHQIILRRSAVSKANQRLTLRAETAGAVQQLFVEKGDRVAAGQRIIQIHPGTREAQRTEAEVLIQQRQKELGRARTLAARQAAPVAGIEQAETNLATAQRTLEQIERDISYTLVQAPREGIVESEPVQPGEFLNVGSEIARFISLDPLLLSVNLTEEAVASVQIDDTVEGEMFDGEPFEGRVHFIAPAADPETRTFEVEIEVPNADLKLREGQTAVLFLPLRTVRGHFVPPSLLTLSDTGEIGVKIVDDQDAVHFVTVQLVEQTLEGVWVTGLPDQATIISVGQEFVSQGQKVEVVADSTDQGG